MKKTVVLLLFFLSITVFASSSPEMVKLHIQHSCVLKNDKPFQSGSEYYRFKVSVDQGTLPNRKENIRQIAIWSDGKLFLIQDFTPIAFSQTENGLNGRFLSEDDLRYIANSHFSKLKIIYEPSIDERQSAKDDTTPYFTSIKTVIEKEEFLPLVLNRNEIDQAINECHDSIKSEQNIQRLGEM